MAVEKITAYRISAEDATAQAWASATKNAADGINSIKSMIPGLATVLSAAGFIELVKGSINALDALNDLSKTTGLTVETLAGLKIAAKQSGGDLDSIAASIEKLAVNMGKAPEKFKALGISAKDPLEAFKQLADIFNRLNDPQIRAALGAEALGKAWAGAAPLMSEGSAKIAQMVDAGTKASGATTELARKSDELNDKWVLLVGSGGLMNSVLAQMIDPLLRITNQMNEAKQSSDGFFKSLYKFATTGGNNDVIGRWLGLVDEAKETAARTGMGLGSGPRGDRGVPSGNAADAADATAAAAKRAKAFLDAAEIAAKAKADAEKLARESAEFALKSGSRQFDQDMKNLEDKRKVTEESIKLADELAKAEVEAADKQRIAAQEVMQASIDQGLSIADSLRSTAELEAQSYDERLTNLQNYLDASNLSVAAKNDMMERMTMQHEANLGSISANFALERKKFAELTMLQQVSTLFGILESLTSATAQKNREMFELNKVASIANAIIYTFEGANKAYAQGGIFGYAMAAAIIVAGLANVANIASTQFGSGTSPSSAGGPSIAPPINTTSNGSDTGPGQTTIVQLHGDTFGRKQVQALLKQIADESKNGGRVVIG